MTSNNIFNQEFLISDEEMKSNIKSFEKYSKEMIDRWKSDEPFVPQDVDVLPLVINEEEWVYDPIWNWN